MGVPVGWALGFAVMAATTGLAGCGSKATTIGVGGTIKGETFSAAEAVSWFDPTLESSVSLASRTGQCGCSGDKPYDDLQSLLIVIATPGGGMPTQPGTFSVVPPNINQGYLSPGTANVVYDHSPACGQGNEVLADGASGTVTLTRVDSGEIDGSGDVTFQSGDQVTVHFAAPACSANQPACGLYCP
jgi:hypothetical protein